MNKKIYIKDIIDVCNAYLFCGNEKIECTSFSKDTRQIEKNDVYVGIKGTNFDGNLFFDEAFKKGACACILEKNSFNNLDIDKEKYINNTIILVDNSIKALQKLAKYKRSLYDIPVIAVTGSVGKTSTKDMIASVLKQKYNVLKTEGNYNNHIGLPLTILKLKEHDALVLEMGMNNLGEISLLSNIANPNIAVITNIGTAHIGNLGSRENILKAKLEILDGISSNGVLIINNDNDLLHENLENIKHKINVITIGIDNNSDYNAYNIIDNVFSSKFNINDNDIEVNVGGKPFIYNSLVAYAIGKYLNINEKDIIKGIAKFKLSSNRMEKIINNKGVTIINDTYNASYDSVIAALDLINKSNYKRKVLILGDILELGDYSKDIHNKIGKYISNLNINKIILVGNEVKYVKEALFNGNFNMNNLYYFEKESDTYNLLNDLLQKDDIVLIKGSHGVNLINIVDKIK
ncbi:MAG: UDP-N-acetylmuramoyl-tripeptide--D-alanyl-D-alanine ligase [Bacilli bacterium]|nr:UDP-N-acetylmuramoyl-tripeptide--D-alanyl-D-alanine ligase [Bacilli bacterium]